MKITFVGGAKTVTGSCYLLENSSGKLLVDCGMFQGAKELQELNDAPWPFHPKEISYVLLTHAHMDHAGLLPKLKRDGFKGKIICSKPTHDLCTVMLPDSGHIHELETKIKNRARSRQRREKKKPLYTADEARAVLPFFVSVPYHQKIQLSPSLTVRLHDAGHILGSSIIELWVKEGEQETKFVFSGDIGSTGQAIVRDPERISQTDYLFVESTYGNRIHPPIADRSDKLLEVIRQAQQDNGLLIIPAFAIGRTQELLFHLHKLFKNGSIRDIPVYVDSPLAIAATEIFQANPDEYDEESAALFSRGENPLSFPGLHYVRTQEESQQLNNLQGCAIIIAGSGMADAGRIRHHFKHQLWKENNHVVFVGYQAEGSLGRKLLSGATRVRLFGTNVRVGAKIHDLTALSAHADKEQLLSWLKGFQTPPKRTFIVHGEESASLEFMQIVHQELGWECYVPNRGETLEIGKQDSLIVSPVEEPAQLFLSEAELQAYLQAIERNVDGLEEALHKNLLSEELRLQLSERLIKVIERLDDLNEYA